MAYLLGHRISGFEIMLIFNFQLFVPTILDKMDEKLRPPLPPSMMEKWCIFVVAQVHH